MSLTIDVEENENEYGETAWINVQDELKNGNEVRLVVTKASLTDTVVRVFDESNAEAHRAASLFVTSSFEGEPLGVRVLKAVASKLKIFGKGLDASSVIDAWNEVESTLSIKPTATKGGNTFHQVRVFLADEESEE